MTVIILEAVPPGLRGLLTRWMVEPAPGVFVGTVSARVRDLLWSQVRLRTRDGYATIAYRAQTEQGFRLDTYGAPRREVIDFDGLQLVRFLR